MQRFTKNDIRTDKLAIYYLLFISALLPSNRREMFHPREEMTVLRPEFYEFRCSDVTSGGLAPKRGPGNFDRERPSLSSQVICNQQKHKHYTATEHEK